MKPSSDIMKKISGKLTSNQYHSDANFVSKLREEQSRVVQDLQRQLENVKRTNEVNAERMAQDHQRQLDHIQKTNEANAERLRKRAEAEVSDLQKSLSNLEADLEKVNNGIFLLEFKLMLVRRIKTTCRTSKPPMMNTQQIRPNELFA
jgi:predicted nuclease with TOPRIM domain